MSMFEVTMGSRRGHREIALVGRLDELAGGGLAARGRLAEDLEVDLAGQEAVAAVAAVVDL